MIFVNKIRQRYVTHGPLKHSTIKTTNVTKKTNILGWNIVHDLESINWDEIGVGEETGLKKDMPLQGEDNNLNEFLTFSPCIKGMQN